MRVGLSFIPFQPPDLPFTPNYLTDTEVIDSLVARFPNVLRGTVKAVDKFSTYDFSNDLYLIEVKCRRKRYDPWMIEKHKVDANCEIADRTGQQLLYVSEYKGTAHVWNIMRLLHEDYDFGWTTKNLPKTTDFSRREWVKKHVGYVYEKDAKRIKLIEPKT
jgi:hypothetical protein